MTSKSLVSNEVDERPRIEVAAVDKKKTTKYVILPRRGPNKGQILAFRKRSTEFDHLIREILISEKTPPNFEEIDTENAERTYNQ